MDATTIGVWIGALLTLLVFSYLLGDTPLFRLAQAVFVGVTVGYATTVAVYLVLLPQLLGPLLMGNYVYIVPLLLGIMLLLKLRPSWGAIGNIPLAYLFGVGGALAIGGALSGALLPQLGATLVSFSPFQNADALVNNLILAVGTIGALLSFRFVTGGDRPAARVLDVVARRWGYVGRWFILISFGAIFASTAASRISILVSRMYYLLHDAFHLVP
jgi:hypothetical protein